MNNLTFGMIKPDAVKNRNSGKIIDMIEANGFEILRLHKVILDKETAAEFYAVHKDRPFFGEMVDFLSSGPVVIMALSKENAVQEWRNLIGATDPAKAENGTIRKLFGTSIGNNAVHGSDSDATAEEELAFFFAREIDEEMGEEDDEDDLLQDEEACCTDEENDCCC